MKVLLRTSDGLGNRIKALVSAYRLTDEVATTCNTFSIILKNPIPVIREPTTGYALFEDWWRLSIKESDDIGEKFSTVYLQTCPEELQSSRALDFEYFRIPERVRNEIACTYSKLVASDRIREIVDGFSNGWGDGVIAVHARSNTTIGDDPNRQSVFDLNLFFREIDRRRKDLRIFVAADNPVLVDAFVDRYGARVLSHPCGRPTESTHTVVSTNEETLIAAFVEMLCLSRGVILIGSYISTFTECAWWFGGAKQHVVIL